jgi:4-amino-4-deoxy-L-arabinose transferase-like glycosyltransferase
MLVALPAACLLLCFTFLYARREAGAEARTVLLRAAAVWGVLLAGITEVLTAFHALAPAAIAASWGASAAALGAAGARVGRNRLPRGRSTPIRAPALAMLLAVAVIVVGTALSAAAGWPNQWDAMVYHLSRVDHWIQNRGIGFYPTHIIRQLFNPPGAEYAIVHLRLLGGDDRWSNAPQWLAMVGSLVGVSGIARRLGAAGRGQLFAVLLAATLPMGILQASGTQNDYVTAFWLVVLADAVLAPPSRWRTFQMGAGMGLALLSKGTAILFAPALLLALPELTAGTWSDRLRPAVPILLLVLALNAPHWARNTATFGWPLGPRDSGSADGVRDKLTNDALTPGIFASNVVRNLSLHAGIGRPGVDRAVQHATEQLHRLVGLDVVDPRSTRLYSDARFRVRGDPTDPDSAGNPVHLVLMVLAAIRVAWSRGLRQSQRLLPRYGIALAAAFLLFCLVLKWQPWHSRLQLPIFVLAAPFIAAAWHGAPRLLGAAAVLLSVLALRPLLYNRLAPLAGKHTVFGTPRADQYFQSFGGGPSSRQREYLAALGLLRERSCERAGLLLGWDAWEHPLWVLQPSPPRRMAHVGVTNGTARLRTPNPLLEPCAVLAGGVETGDTLRLGNRSYGLALPGEVLRVFLPTPAPGR